MNRIEEKVKCVHCSALLSKRQNDGTKSMHSHLNSKHSISCLKEESQTPIKDEDCSESKLQEIRENFINDTEGNNENFEDLSGEKKSGVWKHFLFSRIEELVKCVHCSATLIQKPNYGSKSMHSHLKSQHGITVQKLNEHSIERLISEKENPELSNKTKDEVCTM